MSTEKLDKRAKLTAWLLFLQLMLLYLPSVQFFSIQTDNGNIPASLCYFFSLAFVPLLLANIRQRRKLMLPPWWITGLAGYVILHAFISLPKYGISKNILHWLFGAYLLVVIFNVGQVLTKEQWRRLLEAGAVCFAVLHFLFMLYHHEMVQELLVGYFSGAVNGAYGSLLPSLTRGGRNLDCTWLALGGFFVTGRKKAVYVTYAVLFSFLGGSRVGVIGVTLLILWSLVYDPMYRLTGKAVKWYALYAVCMLVILLGSGMVQAFLNRNMILTPAPAQILETWRTDVMYEEADLHGRPIPFLSIQQATADGNVDFLTKIFNGYFIAWLGGRNVVWKHVPQMFLENPLGYGVGNAMRVMKQSYGFVGFEDVVHNVFLQWLLDEGVIGGLWYIGLGLAFLRRQWKRRPRFFASPFDGYFAAYFVLSLVQFHGGEALMIYVLGIFLLQIRPGEKKQNAA